jgi:hypothetical protein
MEANPKGFRLFLMEDITICQNGWNLGSKIIKWSGDYNLQASSWVVGITCAIFTHISWEHELTYLSSREGALFTHVVDAIYAMKALEVPEGEQADVFRYSYLEKRIKIIMAKEFLYVEKFNGSV